MPISIPKPMPMVLDNLIDACDRLDKELVKHDLLVGARERLEVAALSSEIRRLMPIHLAKERLGICQTQLLELMDRNDQSEEGVDTFKIAVEKLRIAQSVVQEAYCQYCGCTLEELQRLLKNKRKGDDLR